MLKNIDPVLSPRLLEALRAMGHGDYICLDGLSLNQVANAIFSVMPLDNFVYRSVRRLPSGLGEPAQVGARGQASYKPKR